VVVVESASGGLVVKEDVMLAIPMMIVFALLLGWVLVRLTLNALPVFAGFATALVARDLDAAVLASLSFSIFAAIAVAAVGRFAARLRSPALRLALGTAFAIPAGAAAFCAVRGLSGLVSGGVGGTMTSMVVALLIGVMAWQRTTMGSDQA
jgi:hypothetical protein